MDTKRMPLKNNLFSTYRFFARLKAEKVVLHTIHLGMGGSIYTSHTHKIILKSSALIHNRPIRRLYNKCSPFAKVLIRTN